MKQPVILNDVATLRALVATWRRAGDTIALGGLISEDVSKSNSGVPFLERIPLLGAAFRNTDNTKTRTELVILITPRVVRDDRELHQAMEDLRYEFRAIPGLAPGSTSP